MIPHNNSDRRLLNDSYHDKNCRHYTCYLEDGTVVDNSYNRGQTTNFVLGAGAVIKVLSSRLPRESIWDYSIQVAMRNMTSLTVR